MAGLKNLWSEMMAGRSHGFTLVEMMVTLSILGIAAAFVVPPVNNYFDSLRLKSSIRQLYSDMVLAKVTAMKTLNSQTVLLGGTSGTQQGWLVFGETVNDNGTFDGGENELHDVTLQSGFTLSAADLGTSITFNRNGLLGRGAGSYSLTSSKSSKTMTITISPTGYMSIN